MHSPSSTTPSSPSSPSSPSVPSLANLLIAIDPEKPSQTADALDQLRRALPSLPSSSASLIASALSDLLTTVPNNLLLAHRAVAILAHPALNPRHVQVESAIVLSMDRLLMSAAFQHTALAALQNNACNTSHHRDAVISAVTVAMRTHASNSGLLLRGADLLAFHLTQRSPTPHTSSVRAAASVISTSAHHLCNTTSGASTTLLALLAAARHISSLPFPTPRFSRSSNAVIDDYHFASTVALAMSRHTSNIPVQMHGCELIRVATAPATVIARHAAKEFYTAGCANAVVMALQQHSSDREIVNRGITALRAMLLGGGFHGRAPKSGLQLDPDFAEIIAITAQKVSLAIAAKDRDLSSAAVVLAMDVRSASTPSQKDPSLSQMGRRIMRRIRFGHKLNFYQSDQASNSSIYSANKFDQLFDNPAAKPELARTSFATRELVRTRTVAERQASRDTPKRSKANHNIRPSPRKKDNDEQQVTLTRRWRSVSANRARRAGSLDEAVRMTRTHARAERKPPLALTGSEVANLSRQPSNVFGGASPKPTRVVSMDQRVCGDTDRFRRTPRPRMSAQPIIR